MARPDMTQAQAEAAIRGVSDGFDHDFSEFEAMEEALAKGDAKRFIEMHKRRYVDPTWCQPSHYDLKYIDDFVERDAALRAAR